MGRGKEERAVKGRYSRGICRREEVKTEEYVREGETRSEMGE